MNTNSKMHRGLTLLPAWTAGTLGRLGLALAAALTLTATAHGAVVVTAIQYPPGQGDIVSTDLADSSQSTFGSISATGYTPTGGGGPVSLLVDGAAFAVNETDGFVNDATWLGGDGLYSVTITLDTSVNTLGYDIAQINTYAGHTGHYGTKLQTYDVYYSIVGNPGFTLLAQVDTPLVPEVGNPDYMKVAITDNLAAPLATGLDALRFDMKPNQDSSHSDGYYREFDVLGQATVAVGPEPSAVMLLAVGGLLLRRRKRTAE